jgi:hypothetical protein
MASSLEQWLHVFKGFDQDMRTIAIELMISSHYGETDS